MVTHNVHYLFILLIIISPILGWQLNESFTSSFSFYSEKRYSDCVGNIDAENDLLVAISIKHWSRDNTFYIDPLCHVCLKVDYNGKCIANKYLKVKSELFELEPKSVLNPLIALRVIKKLTKTWKEIKKEIQSDLAENYLKNISKQRETRFPNEDDLNGAIQGLLRLQDTYNLKTRDLANGIVEDININKQMDDPLYPNATNNSKLYEQELLDNGVVEEDFRINIPPLNITRFNNASYLYPAYRKAYEELCRGEKEIVC
uniref:Prolyl 4-hydroxylase alpha-subunit N-terminal domain-containing protein n=1 Tax=Meloidogyne floridensis TaxID=298350 RepID=A0A915P0P0_9BILA